MEEDATHVFVVVMMSLPAMAVRMCWLGWSCWDERRKRRVRIVVVVIMIVMFVVVLLFVMGVGVAVGMGVAVTVAMRMSFMIMPMMVVTKTRHPHQINRQPKGTNYKQLRQPLRLMSFLQSLGRLETNLNTDKHQEHTISKSRQCLDFAKTVRKALGGWPFGGYGGEETQAEGDAVEEHVDGVGEEAE